MDWPRMLAYVTGTVNQELLAQNEYLIAENRILKAQLKGRRKLSDAEQATLGEMHKHNRHPLVDGAHDVVGFEVVGGFDLRRSCA